MQLNLRRVFNRSAPTKRATPFSAGGWSTASFVISQAIGSLLYLPLARLLVADDFGLLTEAALISTGLTLVGELGLMRGLIRLDGDRDALAHATLWLSVVVGLLGMALCALAGAPMAAIYDDGRLVPVLLALSPAVLFTALGTVPHALLSRELDFRRKTLPETVSIGVGGLVALAAAVLGAGAYSLVLYALLRTLLSSLVAWWVVGWPPRAHLRRPDPAVMRAVLGFGLPATGGDLALYARLNADYAITGRRLGTEPLGVYTLAWNAAASPAALIGSFFGGVGFATFSRLQHNRERLRAVYLAATRLIAVLALPLFISAVFLRDDLVSVLYGERWAGMVAPLLPLFLLQGVREVCRPGASLTLALGHNRLYAACGILALPLTVTAVLIGTRYGITGVSWGMLLAVGGSSLLWPVIGWTALRPSPAESVRVFLLPLLLAAVTAPTVALTQLTLAQTPAYEWLRLLVAVLAGFGVFLLAARLSWRSLRTDIDLLRESLPEESEAAESVVAEPVLVVPAVRAAPVAET